jgi:hypothetical protein
MSVNWTLVFQFPKPTTILKHTLFLDHYTPYRNLIFYENMNWDALYPLCIVYYIY